MHPSIYIKNQDGSMENAIPSKGIRNTPILPLATFSTHLFFMQENVEICTKKH